jgi:hypothetical protein
VAWESSDVKDHAMFCQVSYPALGTELGLSGMESAHYFHLLLRRFQYHPENFSMAPKPSHPPHLTSSSIRKFLPDLELPPFGP